MKLGRLHFCVLVQILLERSSDTGGRKGSGPHHMGHGCLQICVHLVRGEIRWPQVNVNGPRDHLLRVNNFLLGNLPVIITKK